MSSRPRPTTRPRRARLVGAAVLVPLLALGATACGEDDGGADPTGVTGGAGLDAVKVTGDFGKEAKVEFSDSVTVDQTESEVLIEGDGDEIQADDTVSAHVVIANGVDKTVTSDDFGGSAQPLALGAQMLTAFNDNLVGEKVGSRVLIAATPEDAFGEYGQPELGIGNKDTAVFVIDVMSIVATEPSGTEQKPAAWVPEITEADGVPTGLKFAGKPKPGPGLQVSTLIKGDGAPVKKGQSASVNYLGQVLGGNKPFDDSYSKGQPFSVKVGAGQVIKGWDQSLEGVPVGSRIVISVPPELGYGKEGRPDGGIPPNSTLVFIIDVLSAS